MPWLCCLLLLYISYLLFKLSISSLFNPICNYNYFGLGLIHIPQEINCRLQKFQCTERSQCCAHCSLNRPFCASTAAQEKVQRKASKGLKAHQNNPNTKFAELQSTQSCKNIPVCRYMQRSKSAVVTSKTELRLAIANSCCRHATESRQKQISVHTVVPRPLLKTMHCKVHTPERKFVRKSQRSSRKVASLLNMSGR